MSAWIPPEQRRQQVIAAAFRLLVAEGMTGVSLRKVAVESGLNIGSVRHYFDGQHDLLTAAAAEASAQLRRRLSEHPAEKLRGLTGEAALDALQNLVETVMPVDEPRRDEAIVVIELITASRTMPVFHATSERMAADLTSVLQEALDALNIPDADLAATQLAAVISGLTLSAVTPHGSLSVERVRAALRAHLRMVLGEGPREWVQAG
ncbi:TetR/AcrR family transcriptional regulator [Austwickia sp. TVS 96-490-7B]|uniref:TetR/AcrR family transcriptional regulator n=1 Tax=Austwickia sp. TVS 96-490-7B TaxID=2830843 RepID=UPI001C59A612|nr:TetR family transcriptional regulator C-terminal domain-containing protein [Austwickia sp. TVS 96-490-7B]